jgi:2-succinyl-6-hydroxy-2,4-cyclohexadiene-1-carboxylate synthase
VLFLHGFMGAAANWRPVMERSDDARSLAVDLPGHGAATGRPERAYTMEGCVAALEATLRFENVRSCAVVGYSMGGRLALHFALMRPARYRGLLLESASPGLRTEAKRQARRRTDAERARRIRSDFRGFLEAWYRMPLFASLARHGLVGETVARRLENEPAELARSLAGMGTGQQASLWPRLTELEQPARVVTGALDEKYRRLTREMATRSRGLLRRVVVEEAGHNVHAERPARFMEEVEALLKAAA